MASTRGRCRSLSTSATWTRSSRWNKRPARMTSCLSSGHRSKSSRATSSPTIFAREWACGRTTTAIGRAGVYLTGPQSGATHNTAQQLGTWGRATYQVLQEPDYTLHLGVDAGALLKPPAPGGIRSITLSDRPEVRVDPTVILSTGLLGTAANPLNGAQVYGIEAAATLRNFYLQGEYFHIDVDRQGLATNGFDGGYIEASWIITGENRGYLPAAGAYTNPV